MWSAESRFILPSPIDEQDTLEQEVCQDDANQIRILVALQLPLPSTIIRSYRVARF